MLLNNEDTKVGKAKHHKTKVARGGKLLFS